MNESAKWIARLFIRDNTPLDRREILTALCILWFINVFSFSSLLDSVLSTVLAGRKGVIWLSGYSIFSQMFSAFISTGIPWTFFLLLGCIGLMHRVFQNTIKLSLLFGAILFLFYRSLTLLLPALLAGIGSLLGYFTDELYLASMGNFLIGIGISLIGPLFLAIAIAPPMKHLPQKPLSD